MQYKWYNVSSLENSTQSAASGVHVREGDVIVGGGGGVSYKNLLFMDHEMHARSTHITISLSVAQFFLQGYVIG